MTNQQQIRVKNEIMRCSAICRGISGRTIEEIGGDEDTIRDLCESRRLKKVPVQLKVSSGLTEKVTIYEDVAIAKARRDCCLTESSASLICAKNRIYLMYRDQAEEWLDEPAIIAHCSKYSSPQDIDRPEMMFLTSTDLVGVYFDRKGIGMSDDDRNALKEKYKLDICMVCSFR